MKLEPIWDGCSRVESLGKQHSDFRIKLAEAARLYDWNLVFALLAEEPRLINSTKPGGSSLYAPLHQVAHGGATVEVAARLVGLGAWRLLRDAKGMRPLDVALMKGHTHLGETLRPVLRRNVLPAVVAQLRAAFHDLIRQRAAEQVAEHALRLPELEVMLEFREEPFWFPVPGMCGGFSYWMEGEGVDTRLVSESWCRVVEGSGQRHEITVAGCRLVEEGFV